MNLKLKNHCFIFRVPRDLNSGTYALGNSILSLTEFLLMFQCKRLQKNSTLVISFIPFKNFAVAWVDVVRGFFGTLSDCRLFTCGTHGIVFYSSRRPAPFPLTNVGTIAVFAFNPVNDACSSFFRCTVLCFFEDRSKRAYGIKSSSYVELLQYAFYPVRYHGKANRVRMVVLWARPLMCSLLTMLLWSLTHPWTCKYCVTALPLHVLLSALRSATVLI